jgi:hypothetical protein
MPEYPQNRKGEATTSPFCFLRAVLISFEEYFLPFIFAHKKEGYEQVSDYYYHCIACHHGSYVAANQLF